MTPGAALVNPRLARIFNVFPVSTRLIAYGSWRALRSCPGLRSRYETRPVIFLSPRFHLVFLQRSLFQFRKVKHGRFPVRRFCSLYFWSNTHVANIIILSSGDEENSLLQQGIMLRARFLSAHRYRFLALRLSKPVKPNWNKIIGRSRCGYFLRWQNQL